MSGQPTPGPWTFEKYWGDYALRQDSRDKRYFATLRPRLDQFPVELGEANARLIVSSPELLEAAKEAERLLLPLAESTEEHDRYQVMVLVLRQAIAKAEGRE